MHKPTLALIAAVAKNGTIGLDGSMPWSLPADLDYFRRTTQGHTVIMGRRTWESLGRALPNRRNIVVTSKSEAIFPGADTAGSLELAIAMCAGEEQVFCIGGAVLYEAAMPLAELLYITDIKAEIEGDTFFPSIAAKEWRNCYGIHGDPAGVDFDFLVYARSSR